jgi:hypothetical protein
MVRPSTIYPHSPFGNRLATLAKSTDFLGIIAGIRNPKRSFARGEQSFRNQESKAKLCQATNKASL